jgi:hypothetical protein
MTRPAFLAVCLLGVLNGTALAAAIQRPAPPGAPAGAPAEYTTFSLSELRRGFLAIAFGSDLRIGSKPKGIRKFSGPARVAVLDQGSVSRGDAYRKILREFAEKIPNLPVSLAADEAAANIVVRLINEKDFVRAIEDAFGKPVARRFIAQTNPQCVTSVKSGADGAIQHADVFIIADKGDMVFYDCAYHETLHAFGLSNHANDNPWTILNQNREIGYLTVYDRALLAMLYDPNIVPGMTPADVTRALPVAAAALPFPH